VGHYALYPTGPPYGKFPLLSDALRCGRFQFVGNKTALERATTKVLKLITGPSTLSGEPVPKSLNSVPVCARPVQSRII
jgi:hypothetical protein